MATNFSTLDSTQPTSTTSSSSSTGGNRLLLHEQTQTIEQLALVNPTQTTLRLKLKNPTRTERRVNWAENTVDNEFLDRKKSKCCCIFEKTRNWDESSSEDENEDKECKNCRGHRKTDFNHLNKKNENTQDGDSQPQADN